MVKRIRRVEQPLETPTASSLRSRTRVRRGGVRLFRLGDKLEKINLTRITEELDDMQDVLMGRVEPPFNAGVMTLMEVADAYYARAQEINRLLLRGEREGWILRGSAHYKFRTGELRVFLELAHHATALGSRRVTNEQLLHQRSQTGRSSEGGVGDYEDDE